MSTNTNDKAASKKAASKTAKKVGRKNYTDSLGREWTWDVEAKKYCYVSHKPQLTVKLLREMLQESKAALAETKAKLTDDVHGKDRLTLQAQRRRIEKKVEKLAAKMVDLKTAKAQAKAS